MRSACAAVCSLDPFTETEGGQVWEADFSADGSTIAFAGSQQLANVLHGFTACYEVGVVA